MRDYIERAAVLELLRKWADGYSYIEIEAATAIRGITAIPAADVQPVVRGEWIWEENEWQYRCSACRITFDYDKTYELFDHGYQYANFCPNCGADTRKANDEKA